MEHRPISFSSTPLHTLSLPSLSRSISSLADSSLSPLLSINHLVSLQDVPMDSFEPRHQSHSIKRKAVFEYVSTYPTPSIEFDEPDPKRAKTISDSELSVLAKLDNAFDFFKTLGWNTNEFLHHFFAPKSRDTLRSRCHGIIIENFFSGSGKCSVSEVLEAWWTTADGSGYYSSDTYSVTTPYTCIGPVRSALSSFAAQIIEHRLLEEAQIAVQETSGQHAYISSDNDNGSTQWADIGGTLIPTVKNALQTH
jgi:hypothetical protein